MWFNSKESACQCRNHLETRVQSLGLEDPVEEEMATHSSILAWNSMDRGAWGYGPLGQKESDSWAYTKQHNRWKLRNTINESDEDFVLGTKPLGSGFNR